MDMLKQHIIGMEYAETFMLSGYEVLNKDQCIFIKCKDENVIFCGSAVDECFFVCKNGIKFRSICLEKI